VLAVIVGVIVFAGVAGAVWLLNWGSSDNTKGAATSLTSVGGALVKSGAGATVAAVRPEIVSPAQLREIAAANRRPLYWAGPRKRTRLEYTRMSDGRMYVRYLTGSAKAGAAGAGYVVVATYSQPDAYNRVSAIAKQKHFFVATVANGGIAVAKPNRPQNIYLVYPRQPYQIEVYAPTAAETRKLVFGGAIKPVR
jgi:hypothetical protein